MKSQLRMERTPMKYMQVGFSSFLKKNKINCYLTYVISYLRPGPVLSSSSTPMAMVVIFVLG